MCKTPTIYSVCLLCEWLSDDCLAIHAVRCTLQKTQDNNQIEYKKFYFIHFGYIAGVTF